MSWSFGVFVLVVWVAIGCGFTLASERARARALRERYWKRPCAGLRWHQAFRDSAPGEIRKFLHRFVDAFCLPRERALCFRPEDQVWTIYETDQTAQHMDFHQLETLEWTLLDTYGLRVDLSRREVTLGELFADSRGGLRRGPPLEF